MPNHSNHQEIEIKLRIADLDMMRSLLKKLEARKLSPRTRESNTLYDTPRNELRRRGQLIRIRVERRASEPRKKSRNSLTLPVLLTYKGPLPSTRKASNESKRRAVRRYFKISKELEVPLASANEIVLILTALGFAPSFRYEKFRTTFALPGVRGLKIELDETPVGNFLELEGPISAINRAAAQLGYRKSDYMTDTYGSLYLARCRREGRKPGNMLFSATKKSR